MIEERTLFGYRGLEEDEVLDIFVDLLQGLNVMHYG